MDLGIIKTNQNQIHLHQPQPLSPINNSPTSFSGPHLHSSKSSSFPILAVAIVGMLAISLLLASYYIFIIKCCINLHHIVDLLSRFSFSINQSQAEPVGLFSPGLQTRGLEQSVIQSIPLFPFKRGLECNSQFNECVVCLNEFQEEKKLKAMPNCSNLFHVDCVDVWLQDNVSCPLCRTSISFSFPSKHQFPLDVDQLVIPSLSSDQNTFPNTGNFTGHDEDYGVTGLGGENSTKLPLLRVQERLISPLQRKKVLKFNQVSSRGDECIDIGEKDGQFSIQPIRRSFSMDSVNDRLLFLAVQEIIQKRRHANEVSRSFFTFGNGWGSRSAVLPLDLELDP